MNGKNILLSVFMSMVLALCTLAQYPFGNCLHLDGNNDYIILPDESAFDFPVNMTVEAWINVDEWDHAWQAVITKGDNAWRLQRDNQTDKIVFVAGGEHVITSTSFTDSLWHHIAGVKSGSTLRIYVDGVQESTTDGAGNNANNSYSVRIGENGQATGRYFDGVFEEVRFWNYDRSQGDIEQNMYKTLAGNETGLVAYYKLDETSGLTAHDATANGHHGTLVNMTGSEWEQTTIPMVFTDPGYALDFDGVDDLVHCGEIPELHYSLPRTIEAWAYTRSFNGGGIFQAGTATTTGRNDFSLKTVSETIWRWTIREGAGNYINVTLPQSKNSWHHYCITWDGGAGNFYFDGKLVGSIGGWYIDSYGDFKIGIWENNSFDGIIDEVRVWDYARSQEQIISTMDWTLTGNEPGLIAYWQCSYGTGSTVYDYTGGHHGTLYNMNNQDWVASGAWQFDVQTVTIPDGFTGTLDFDNVGLSMYVNEKTGTDVYTVVRFNNPPTVFPSFPDEVFDSQYWHFINQGSGSLNANLTFTVDEDVNQGDVLCPQRIRLLRSTVNSASWSLVSTADSINEATNQMTFNDLTSFDLFIAGRHEPLEYAALYPPDGFCSAGLNQDFTLTFDRPVLAGSGSLHIFKSSDSTLFETIPATQALIDSNSVTFSPTGTLEHVTSYFILADSALLVDYTGTAFAGIKDATEWEFKTAWFTEIPTAIPGVKEGSGCRWGDYDNDGDLDIAVFGNIEGSITVSRIYRNDGNGNFTDIDAGLIGVSYGDCKWGDTDHDGDLDLGIGGLNGNSLYVNESNNIFNPHPISASAQYGQMDWGDFDNDGDLDLLISGGDFYSSHNTRILKNNGGNVFTVINTGLPPVSGYWKAPGTPQFLAFGNARAIFVDFDLDGDLDVFLAGYYTSETYIARLYRNDGPGTSNNWIFTNINAGFFGCSSLGADWGDYNNDGYPDLILTGGVNGTLRTRIYKNNGDGTFAEVVPPITGLVQSSVQWGDLDNDGDLDFVISGGEYVHPNRYLISTTRFYINEGNDVFTQMQTELMTDAHHGMASWGDYDNDGDLDVMLCGRDLSDQRIFRLYRNNCLNANTPPTMPPNLSLVMQEDPDLTLTFGWDASGDNETPAAGLSYNIGCKLLRNGLQVSAIPFIADTAGGFRRIPKSGNAGQRLGHYLKCPELPLLTQKYRRYELIWGVQAIDHAFAGSPFNMSDTAFIKDITYLAVSSNTEMQPGDWLTWEVKHVDSLTGYRIQLDDQAGFPDPFEEYIDINSVKGKLVRDDKGFTFSIALNGLGFYPSLTDNTVYHWRMRPVYIDGDSTCFTHPAPCFFFNKENTAPWPPLEGFNPAGDVAIGSLNPVIAWNAAFDPDSISDHPGTLRYSLELDTSNTFSSVIFTQTTAMGINYVGVSPALMEGYRYYYRVKTIDDEGLESPWSATQSFRVFDITLYLTLNLEGPFNGTDMNTSLNPAYLPLAQPYGTAPWNYTGTEAVGSIPSVDVVDWVLVELRDAPDAQSATPATIVARQAAFLLSDGTVAGLGGNAPIRFYAEIQDNLFVVIHHRNHLSIMTPVSPPENNGAYTWDFTTGAGQAYGGVNAHKELVTGKWGMISGDGNADRQVSNTDKNDVWRPQSGSSGYKEGDFNLNGQVDNSDKIDNWKPNSGRSSQVPN